jgi:hypothetical protein
MAAIAASETDAKHLEPGLRIFHPPQGTAAFYQMIRRAMRAQLFPAVRVDAPGLKI